MKLDKGIEVSLETEAVRESAARRIPKMHSNMVFISLRNLHKERTSRSSSYRNGMPSLNNIYETEKRWKEMKEKLRNHSVESVRYKGLKVKEKPRSDHKSPFKNTSDSENIENDANEERKHVKKSIVRLFPINSGHKRNSLPTSHANQNCMQRSDLRDGVGRAHNFSFRMARSNCSVKANSDV